MFCFAQNGTRADSVLARIQTHCSGAEAARVVIVPASLPLGEFVQLLSACSAILDLFPFPGGVTSLDAFSVGTPVVTLWSAQSDAGFPQLTSSMYEAMEMADTCCATDSTAAYSDMVVRLGRDDEFRRRVRGLIVARRAVLFENPAVVDEWSLFLRTAVKQSRLGV